MTHRGRKSAAELSVVPLVHASPKPAKRGAKPAPALPPSHLKPDTQAWWRLVTADFKLEKYQYAVLQSAAEAWDLYQHARTQLTKHGLTFTDNKGMVRARPEAAIARDARTSFLRALRELKLDVDPPMTAEDRILKNNARGGRVDWPVHEDDDDAS